jgi:hypothetical protein
VRRMVDGDATQGRRLPDGTSLDLYTPGDYGKRGTMWWVCLPTGVLGHLDDRWVVTEHDDGTISVGKDMSPSITVSPSIWDSPAGWHGYLERGVWREV